MVTLACKTCRATLWAMGFCGVRKSFATVEMAEHEARFLGWTQVEDGPGWLCQTCQIPI